MSTLVYLKKKKIRMLKTNNSLCAGFAIIHGKVPTLDSVKKIAILASFIEHGQRQR